MSSDHSPTDHFAILGEPRRPWLDPEEIKERFHQITAKGHPDLGGDAGAFAAVNAAYRVLRNPGSRLRHLLELEHPDLLRRSGASIPQPLADRFMEVATLRREADAFASQQAAATTPLGRALLASERGLLMRDLQKMLVQLDESKAACIDSIRVEDEIWESCSLETAQRLSQLMEQFAYLEKWIAQLNEQVLQLQM